MKEPSNVSSDRYDEVVSDLIDSVQKVEAERDAAIANVDNLTSVLGQGMDGLCRFPGSLKQCLRFVGPNACKKCWLELAAQKTPSAERVAE